MGSSGAGSLGAGLKQVNRNAGSVLLRDPQT